MIRPVTPELTKSWEETLEKYDGIGDTEAKMLAARMSGDFRLDTKRVSSEEEIEGIVRTAESIIYEVELEGALADESAEPEARDELLDELRDDLVERLDRVDGTKQTPTHEKAVGPPGTPQASDVGTADVKRQSVNSSKEVVKPSDAAELREFVQTLDMDRDEIETVLADIRDRKE
jgi:hypothetical protein